MIHILRNGHFRFRRRVPQRYAKIEDRREFWISLQTDSRSEAASEAEEAWHAMTAGWEARLRGDTADADKALAVAKDICHGCGF